MPSAPCPDCEEIVGISTTEQPVSPGGFGRSMRWRVDVHPDKRLPVGERRVCDGSGKLI